MSHSSFLSLQEPTHTDAGGMTRSANNLARLLNANVTSPSEILEPLHSLTREGHVLPDREVTLEQIEAMPGTRPLFCPIPLRLYTRTNVSFWQQTS